MSNQLLKIGRFELGIPSELMFDVATLKVDLRPAITNLNAESKKLEPAPYVKRVYKRRIPKHEHVFKSYYSKRKCTICGLKKRKYTAPTQKEK